MIGCQTIFVWKEIFILWEWCVMLLVAQLLRWVCLRGLARIFTTPKVKQYYGFSVGGGSFPLPIKHPMIWSILHAKLIYNINWSHTKILHMNDIDRMKCHVYSILFNLTVDFIFDGSALEMFSHSWNNVHCIFIINTTFKHIYTCFVTLHRHHF